MRATKTALFEAAKVWEAGAALEAFVPIPADEGDFRANPLWHAVARGHNPRLVRFLPKQGAHPSYSQWTAVFHDGAACLRVLLSQAAARSRHARRDADFLCRAAPAAQGPSAADRGRRRLFHQGREGARRRRYGPRPAAAETDHWATRRG